MMIACESGKIAPPPSPWTNLEMTIMPIELEIPQKNDETVKTPIHKVKKAFRPINLHKKSTDGMIIPLAIK